MTTQTVAHTMTPPMFSPASSTSTTPSTASSASPRGPHAGLPHAAVAPRQLRPPKSPMYIPAVLRPTERPVSRRAATATAAGAKRSSRTNPPTPPRSDYSSSDGLVTPPAQQQQQQQQQQQSGNPSLHRPTSSSASQQRPLSPSTLAKLTTTLSLTSTSSSLTAPSSPTSNSLAPRPTRVHWKPDAAARDCDAFGCDAQFSLLVRRHHCRRCGGVFCAAHSAQQVPLDADAEFDPAGCWSRACEGCAARWAERLVTELQRCQSIDDETLEEATSPPTPLPVDHRPGSGGGPAPAKAAGKMVGSVAGSVGRDWSWSTF